MQTSELAQQAAEEPASELIPDSSQQVVQREAAPRFRGALLLAEQVNQARLAELNQQRATHVVLLLNEDSAARRAEESAAAARVRAAGLSLGYWVEVARCPELAAEHPEWLASLQTHPEWRRFFPETPEPEPDEVVKTWPWLPILSREPFAAQLTRIKQLLAEREPAECVFLNDLQGAPSACGCGNALCRWTSDYGRRRTTTPLENDAPALFVEALQAWQPEVQFIPVWTTECEERDGAEDGHCAGVGCFTGICWKAYTEQLMPVGEACEQMGVLCLYKAFDRDLPAYGPTAGWIRAAVESFQSMPPRHAGEAVASSRLIAVLQGWDVTEEELLAQQERCRELQIRGNLIAYTPLDQSWQPKIVRWR